VTRTPTWVLVSALIVALTGCASDEPPLIRGARAGSGDAVNGSVCPKDVALLGPTAVSPELTARLNSQFPSGSQENKLLAELVRQGFVVDPEAVCKDDRAIRSARYKHGGFYTTYADVYWKSNAAHRIVWTKGVVAFVGL
jgi:hypothetical protein